MIQQNDLQVCDTELAQNFERSLSNETNSFKLGGKVPKKSAKSSFTAENESTDAVLTNNVVIRKSES